MKNQELINSGKRSGISAKPSSSCVPAFLIKLQKLVESQGDDFAKQLAYWKEACTIVTTPEAVLIVRSIHHPDRTESGWFVQAAVGPLSALAKMFPSWKPWVAFNRAKAHHTGKHAEMPRIYNSKRLYDLATR